MDNEVVDEDAEIGRGDEDRVPVNCFREVPGHNTARQL